jgi:hypothetical protein
MSRCGGFYYLQRRFGIRNIDRIDEHCDASGPRYQFTQQSEPLCRQFGIKDIDAGQVTTRPCEAGY